MKYLENVLHIRIRERRTALKLTQTQLAHKLGYSDKTGISHIESGNYDLTLKKILRFAEALKCSPLYLMGFTDDPEE